MRYCIAFFVYLFSMFIGISNGYTQTIISSNLDFKSPNSEIICKIISNEKGDASYQIFYHNTILLDHSQLGLELSTKGNLNRFKQIILCQKSSQVAQYSILNAKKYSINHSYNLYKILLINDTDTLPMEFKMFDDGLAFRYVIKNNSGKAIQVEKENTSFQFLPETKAFLQPVAVAKSGWEATNPSYEENYQQDIPVGMQESTKTGWVYPALFHKGNTWMAITEAGLDGNYCATRLDPISTNGNYSIAFPDLKETIIKNGGILPKSKQSFYSPWRVITIGSLKSLVESTLGTDVADEAKYPESLCKTGQASWSWINSKDDFIVYEEQKKYIDFAASMHWKYCLIDVNWDQKIGYEKMAELSKYGQSKNVGLLLWYNSAGDWNTVKYTPKTKLLTHESREAEFSKLQKMGIKGIKVDFFGGDGQSVIKYYIDILNDAAHYGLMVNFHGATLPRGWARTYPNLMTTEAVKGFESVTFEQKAADQEANHVTMLPFTRNLFDPMDFTPMNLYKIPTHVHRKTTPTFELATSVVLLSGIQHFAESPEGMSHEPDYVKSFLQNLPTHWDDVKFLDGYPGKFIVIARKSGEKWFVAGLNGDSSSCKIDLDLSFLPKNAKGKIFTDGYASNSIMQNDFANKPSELTLKANGGFVLVFE
ncbi:glycoside hydrolase family 97 protein [Rhizosphaericola mali]|uniref:Glycoside hydrolase family 97 protein n=1 Tax=Rhizosphaericola mali TaxID=2545455 RepID=A0A5P2FYR3_9BACT|nr:glycoside hydrolase family 97 protein [Rhizosphaericola mali]QES88646.1 glycoside hydrolase family 97 protein [Rhizosphaericola mali]